MSNTKAALRGSGRNRRAAKFVETLRLADDTIFLADRLINIYPGPGDMDVKTAVAIFETVGELITAAKRGEVRTGRALRELMERTVIYASEASQDIGQQYMYGEEPAVAKTYDRTLIIGVMVIVAPLVVKTLSFPEDAEGTVTGSFAEAWMSEAESEVVAGASVP